jgi:hypothetical protein
VQYIYIYISQVNSEYHNLFSKACLKPDVSSLETITFQFYVSLGFSSIS